MQRDPSISRGSESTHVVVRPAPPNAEVRPETLAFPVTPTELHFRRNNFAVPELDAATHRVAVGGAVLHPFDLDLAGLRALPQRTLTVTLECAGNSRAGMIPLPRGELWQDGAVSTASWRGTSLESVLERAGLKKDVIEILVEGADEGTPRDVSAPTHFARSLPLPNAFDPNTLLALEMNGEPIPATHGAPVRLVVPGWYGMASVKWVRTITALTEPFTGYFQRQRYRYEYENGQAPVPVTAMRVKSRIISPAEGEEVPTGTVQVRGWAWSGAGEVSRVEVAVDGNSPWQEARLLDPVSEHAWRPWEWEWDAAEPGRHALRCRATDAAGNVQPELATWNRHGYGNNAIRSVFVDVR